MKCSSVCRRSTAWASASNLTAPFKWHFHEMPPAASRLIVLIFLSNLSPLRCGCRYFVRSIKSMAPLVVGNIEGNRCVAALTDRVGMRPGRLLVR